MPPKPKINKGGKPVDHTYLDYTQKDLLVQSPSFGTAKGFPAKLHKILSDPSYNDVIAWAPHGRSFRVLDKKRFIEEVAPKFFNFSKIESFHRQLTGWGFKRMYQHGPDHQAYYHQQFLRGLPGLVKLMKRTGDGFGKTVPNVNDEPDFYKYALKYPLSAVEEPKPEDEAADALSSLRAQAPALHFNPYGCSVPVMQQQGYVHTSPHLNPVVSYQMGPQFFQFQQQGMAHPALYSVLPPYYQAPAFMPAVPQPFVGAWNPFSFA